MTRRTLLVVACGAVIVAISMGVRQAFGVFLLPISSDLQLGREVFGLTLALQNLLFGLFSPFIGVAADRFGAARVIVLCTLLYAGGLLLATLSTQPIELYLTLGLLVGVGLSGTTYVVVLGVWTVSIALGVAAALIHWPIADAPAPRLIGAKP